MLVKELLKILQSLDQDLTVYVGYEENDDTKISKTLYPATKVEDYYGTVDIISENCGGGDTLKKLLEKLR